MSPGPEALAGLLAGLAGWLMSVRRRRPATSAPSPPARRWPAQVGRLPFRRRPPAIVTDAEVVALAERLAALARAGVSDARAWQVLATTDGPGARAARVVAGMAATGGSVAAGVRLAATGPPPGPPALRWLGVAQDVLERCGAPPAALLDRFASAARAEIAQAEERSVALAGPRATAAVLAVLPLAAPLLGWLIGADPVAAFGGTPAGRWCLAVGAAAWIAGRWWTARLVAAAAGAGT